MQPLEVKTKPYLAWVVVFSASLFFFYEFIQMNMFNTINYPMREAFHLTALEVSRLSAFYFIANVIFLFPAGMILDRFSTRAVILTSLGICIVGTFFLGLAPNVFLATIFRFFTGIGSAFCFLSCVRLASRWFAPKRMALVVGLIVTMAMIGGMVAQTPMTLLTHHFGWRHALMLDAGLGVIIFIAIALLVKNYPTQFGEIHQLSEANIKSIGLINSVKYAIFNLQNWAGGFYTCFLNLPIFILGGLWGMQYLQHVHDLKHTDASYVTSMLFIGTIIGAPLMGYLSDKIGRRKLPMILGAIVSLIVIFAMMYLPHLDLLGLMVLFLLLGFVTSTQVISYPTIAEINPLILTATCVSVISFTTIGGGAVFEPVFGWLLDLHWNGTLLNGVPAYSPQDFQFAMWLFPVTFFLGLIASFLIKETFCKRKDAVNGNEVGVYH